MALPEAENFKLHKKAKKLRETLIDRIKQHGKKKVDIPLSGGVDSHCALFAALEAGCKPTVYSVHMKGVDSRDWRTAQHTAEVFNVPLVEIELPNDMKTLMSDMKWLAEFGCRSKTEYECFWPMKYLVPELQNKVVFTGHGADSLYCSSRKANQHFKGREDEFRDMAFSNPRAFQQHLLTKITGQRGITYCPIFYCNEVKSIFKGVPKEQLNNPIQKALSRFAFEEYFEQTRVYVHQNMQLGDSGIASHFEALLESPLNVNNYKSVVGIYNELSRKAVEKPKVPKKGLFA